MKKLFIFFSILISFCYSSCIIPEDTLPPSLDLSIDKVNVSVNEEIQIVCIIDKIYNNEKTNFILYIENFPENTTIIEGTKFEPLSTDKYLCITPAYLEGNEGVIKFNISYSSPGKYTLSFNGCDNNLSTVENNEMWNKDLYTYLITVTE